MTIIRQIGVLVMISAAVGAIVLSANQDPKALCIKITDALSLGGNCSVQTIPTDDEYTRQIFSGECRWQYRGNDLLKVCPK